VAAGGRIQVFIQSVPGPGMNRGAARCFTVLDLNEGHFKVIAVQPVLGPLQPCRCL